MSIRIIVDDVFTLDVIEDDGQEFEGVPQRSVENDPSKAPRWAIPDAKTAKRKTYMCAMCNAAPFYDLIILKQHMEQHSKIRDTTRRKNRPTLKTATKEKREKCKYTPLTAKNPVNKKAQKPHMGAWKIKLKPASVKKNITPARKLPILVLEKCNTTQSNTSTVSDGNLDFTDSKLKEIVAAPESHPFRSEKTSASATLSFDDAIVTKLWEDRFTGNKIIGKAVDLSASQPDDESRHRMWQQFADRSKQRRNGRNTVPPTAESGILVDEVPARKTAGASTLSVGNLQQIEQTTVERTPLICDNGNSINGRINVSEGENLNNSSVCVKENASVLQEESSFMSSTSNAGQIRPSTSSFVEDSRQIVIENVDSTSVDSVEKKKSELNAFCGLEKISEANSAELIDKSTSSNVGDNIPKSSSNDKSMSKTDSSSVRNSAENEQIAKSIEGKSESTSVARYVECSTLIKEVKKLNSCSTTRKTERIVSPEVNRLSLRKEVAVKTYGVSTTSVRRKPSSSSVSIPTEPSVGSVGSIEEKKGVNAKKDTQPSVLVDANNKGSSNPVVFYLLAVMPTSASSVADLQNIEQITTENAAIVDPSSVDSMQKKKAISTEQNNEAITTSTVSENIPKSSSNGKAMKKIDSSSLRNSKENEQMTKSIDDKSHSTSVGVQEAAPSVGCLTPIKEKKKFNSSPVTRRTRSTIASEEKSEFLKDGTQLDLEKRIIGKTCGVSTSSMGEEPTVEESRSPSVEMVSCIKERKGVDSSTKENTQPSTSIANSQNIEQISTDASSVLSVKNKKNVFYSHKKNCKSVTTVPSVGDVQSMEDKRESILQSCIEEVAPPVRSVSPTKRRKLYSILTTRRTRSRIALEEKSESAKVTTHLFIPLEMNNISEREVIGKTIDEHRVRTLSVEERNTSTEKPPPSVVSVSCSNNNKEANSSDIIRNPERTLCMNQPSVLIEKINLTTSTTLKRFENSVDGKTPLKTTKRKSSPIVIQDSPGGKQSLSHSQTTPSKKKRKESVSRHNVKRKAAGSNRKKRKTEVEEAVENGVLKNHSLHKEREEKTIIAKENVGDISPYKDLLRPLVAKLDLGDFENTSVGSLIKSPSSRRIKSETVVNADEDFSKLSSPKRKQKNKIRKKKKTCLPSNNLGESKVQTELSESEMCNNTATEVNVKLAIPNKVRRHKRRKFRLTMLKRSRNKTMVNSSKSDSGKNEPMAKKVKLDPCEVSPIKNKKESSPDTVPNKVLRNHKPSNSNLTNEEMPPKTIAITSGIVAVKNVNQSNVNNNFTLLTMLRSGDEKFSPSDGYSVPVYSVPLNAYRWIALDFAALRRLRPVNYPSNQEFRVKLNKGTRSKFRLTVPADPPEYTPGTPVLEPRFCLGRNFDFVTHFNQ